MPYSILQRVGGCGILAVGLLLLPACSRPQDPVGGSTISGKVTYKGQPVVYGFVVFYELKEGLDPETGEVKPAGVGKIENGAYSAEHVPAGNMMVCVACDPDIATFELIGPRKLGGDLDPKSFRPAGAPGSDPSKKDLGPKGKEDKPAPPGKDDQPTPVGPPPAVDPAVAKLTAEQKAILKEIHSKFGRLGMSPLRLEVQESDRTFDLILPK